MARNTKNKERAPAATKKPTNHKPEKPRKPVQDLTKTQQIKRASNPGRADRC